MMEKPERQEDEYGPEETARRRDAVLKVMVNMPPQPRNKPARKRKSARRVKAKAGPEEERRQE
jgi:hypothetical protein